MDYMKNPVGAIKNFKEKSGTELMQGSLTMIFVASIIFAVNTVIGLMMLEAMPLQITGPEILVSVLEMGTANMAAGVFSVVLLGGLFFGFVTKVVMNVLGGDGEYWSGLATVSCPALSVSIGVLLAMVFSHVPTLGPVLAFLFVAVFLALGYASMFRLAKDMFDVGMIEAFVGVMVILAVGLVAIYGGLLTTPEGIMAVLPAP